MRRPRMKPSFPAFTSGRYIQELERRLRTAPGRPDDQTLYIDRALAVLNKQPRWVCTQHAVERSRGERSLTDVFNDFQQRFGRSDRPIQVHRLDKMTTGVYLIALTSERGRALAALFRKHAVKKTYLALVNDARGLLLDKREDFVTNQLRRNADGTMNLASAPEPTSEASSASSSKASSTKARVKANAETHIRAGVYSTNTAWRVLSSSEDKQTALLELKPSTGVKHQLRIHCARVLGTPIIGDYKYNVPNIREPSLNPHSNLYLHASAIGIPRFRKTGGHKAFTLTVRAPLPDYWLRKCESLGIELHGDALTGGVWVDNNRAPDGCVPELDGRWVWDDHLKG